MYKTSSMDKEKKEWRQSSTSDNLTTEICVKEVENGFLVKIKRYGYKLTKAEDMSLDDIANKATGIIEDREYIDECKEYISKTNPLEEEEKSITERISEALSSIKI